MILKLCLENKHEKRIEVNTMGKENFFVKIIISGLLLTNLLPAGITTLRAGQDAANNEPSLHKRAIIVDAHNHKFCLSDIKSSANNQMAIPAVVDGQMDVIGHFFAYHPLDQVPLLKQLQQDIVQLKNCLANNACRALVLSDLTQIIFRVSQNYKVVIPGLEYFYGVFNNDPTVIDSLYELGIRVLTLMDNQYDQLSRRATSDIPDLNTFGKKVIRRMNELGMVIDISHLDDNMQLKVIAYSNAPVIASHSSVRGVHDVPRNIPDNILQQLAAKKGLIMITFNSGVLTGLERGRTDINSLIKHIDHAVKVAGIDHVGIGSDFNGAGVRSPIGLETAAGFPNITRHLIEAGYSDQEVEKIMGRNYLDLISKVINQQKNN